MHLAVIGHHSRQERAEQLANSLGATLFLDEADHGPTWNHLRALEWAAGERILVLEDDALPVEGFHAKAQAWIDCHPDDLISFYLGTGHPIQWMRRVDEQWGNDADHVTLPTLIHGVCYTIPRVSILEHIDKRRPADYGIGDAWKRLTGRHVVYPKRSIVDHDEQQPSITQAQRGRTPRSPRHARLLSTVR